MKICMVVEGSYPYVTGGVSSWLQMLISLMPEHEFIVYSVAAEEKQRGCFKYEIPENVIEVKEVFLDSILHQSVQGLGKCELSPQEAAAFEALICGERNVRLQELLPLFQSGRAGKKRSGMAMNIFMSFSFFDVVQRAYQRQFGHLPFTDFFWTVRSMLLPLLYLLEQDLPEADVYHSVAAGYAGVIAMAGAAQHKKPFLLTEHGIYAREREEEIIQSSWAGDDFKGLWINYFYSLAKLSYQEASKVLTLFRQNAEMEAYLGCDPAKIEVVPNGVNASRFAGTPGKRGDGRTVGAIVRVVPIKDIMTMLRAFALVRTECPESRFFIIGPIDENEEYFEECQNLAGSLGLSDVVFTGTVDVREYLPKLDLLMLTSISEGQPLALLEGMAAGKPFVCTDVGACRELLLGEDGFGPAGYVVPMLDAPALAQGVVKLLRDPKLREEMGENGRRRVGEQYTRQRFIDRYRQVYEEVASDGRNRL